MKTVIIKLKVDVDSNAECRYEMNNLMADLTDEYGPYQIIKKASRLWWIKMSNHEWHTIVFESEKKAKEFYDFFANQIKNKEMKSKWHTML